MKKNKQADKEFKILKQQLGQIKEIVAYTRVSQLWSHEAAVRKKLKVLGQMRGSGIKEIDDIYEGYRELLDDLSERLLQDYNVKNKQDYKLAEIIADNPEGYLNSGIITILMKTHIPKKVAKAFETHFPANPKDEYVLTRTIKRKVYLHLGETNTGKTYHALQRLMESKKGIYLAPLRILALEIYERLNDEGVKCNLLTGEEEIDVEGANHISSTIEKLHIEERYDVAVIDEIQMIGDAQRGAAWTRALLGLQCKELHVCGAKNAEAILVKILEDCLDDIEIKTYVRNVPLEVEEQYFDLQGVMPGDALITFSKKRVLELAKRYKDRGMKTSIIYGDLPPEVRKLQYQDFISKTNQLLVSTDAIGMGVNLPIRRIVFMDIKKFDGDEVRYLTSQEVKQIAGRAGRKGIYEVGYVSASCGRNAFVKERIQCEDEPIREAVIGPSEALLKIEELPLKEKLALWATREEKSNLYGKMDVRDYLIILELVKKYQLSERKQWRLMKLPFDVGNEALCDTFLDFVEEYFIRKETSLTKPSEGERGLNSLETYYQKVNLYYSFSKSFKLDFDEKWVYEERRRISEKINQLLVNIRI
ncbi:helicase-related protein [Niameybacter massiliensis]|uniref:RNA helicase n=1 Tax=Holtiella tumoricola TaxID=3018743 RepID=A0AA42DKS6_9FIRM|nr:helicase-related protein [Holtiella tumoricola]MDA3730897.1 helicase-related protein [Holtiella tumoricola]